MEINNRTSINLKRKPEILIKKLVDSIPKRLVPRLGFPDFHLTNTLLHSYAVMYEKYEMVSSQEAQQNFLNYIDTDVWAFTSFKIEEHGDVYLALDTRYNGIVQYHKPIEFVVLHEIGHHWLFGRFEQEMPSGELSENRADDYAMACFLNYVSTNNIRTGFEEPFHPMWKEVVQKAKGIKINGNNAMKKGTETMSWLRTRRIQYGI